MKRRWWKLGLILAVGVVAGGVVWTWRQPPEPSYQGKSATEWIELQLSEGFRFNPDVDKAFAAMGPAAEPYVVTALRHRNSWRQSPRYAKLFRSLPWFARKRLPMPPPQWNTRGDNWSVAGQALRAMGPGLDSYLPSLARDGNVQVRRAAAVLLDAAPGDARVARRLILSALADPDAEVRFLALGATPRLDDSVIPLLIGFLEKARSTNTYELGALGMAAQQLGRRGIQARAAVPALTKLLGDNNEHLRLRAKLALLEIERRPEVLASVVNELSAANDFSAQLAILESLGRLGPDARAAVPTLVNLWRMASDQMREPERALSLGGPGVVAVKAAAGPSDPIKADDQGAKERRAAQASWTGAFRVACERCLKQIAPEVAVREGIP